jgi:hypothetical protein
MHSATTLYTPQQADQFHHLLRAKTLNIAALFGTSDAAAAVLDAVHAEHGADANPDKAMYTSAMLAALGLDASATARVFKLFHQRFVLSAYVVALHCIFTTLPSTFCVVRMPVFALSLEAGLALKGMVEMHSCCFFKRASTSIIPLGRLPISTSC